MSIQLDACRAIASLVLLRPGLACACLPNWAPAGRCAGGKVPARRGGGAAAAAPGQRHALDDSNPKPYNLCAQGDALVAGYLHNVAAVLQLRRLSDGGLERKIKLPGLGSVRDFSGRREHSEAFFTYTDFVTPGSFYRLIST